MKNIYIHIPFCNRICSYCDFCKIIYSEEIANKYLIALEKEIMTRYNGEELESIYIGGGTPSVLSISQLTKLFKMISRLNITPNCEITMEFNIEDITKDKLLLVKNNKVNRISIGIQTLNKKFFDLLGRKNDKKETLKKINLCKDYFENINIDLMYGFNGQTISDIDEDINFVLKLEIPHISIYSLIIEPHTKLFIDKYIPLDEDLESNMYYHIVNKLKNNNFKHYEISNFAKEGYLSVHNQVYWNNNEYYGVGLGASGYIGNKRYSNTRSFTKYLKGNYFGSEELLTKDDKMDYQIILNLRLSNGINKETFFNKFGKNLSQCYNYNELVKKGLLQETEKSLCIKEGKWYISNNIILSILEKKIKQ